MLHSLYFVSNGQEGFNFFALVEMGLAVTWGNVILDIGRKRKDW